MLTITMDRYHEVRGGYEGYCTECEEFTRTQTEPDAEGYDCPACGCNTVIGAEVALMCEDIDVVTESV